MPASVTSESQGPNVMPGTGHLVSRQRNGLREGIHGKLVLFPGKPTRVRWVSNGDQQEGPPHGPAEGGRGERELKCPGPPPPSPRWTGLCPELTVQSSLGRDSSWAHEIALSAPSLNGSSMGSSEEHRRPFYVTSPLISRATEMCYR